MSAPGVYKPAGIKEAVPFPDKDAVVEVPLLLTGWQAAALETSARARGLTPAQMLRQLLSEHLTRPGHFAPSDAL